MVNTIVPNVGGFGGFNYQGLGGANANIPGVPGGIQNGNGYAAAAQSILTGSQGAQDALMKAYRSQYQQRAEGIAGAQSEMADRLGAQSSAQGISPDLIQRMLLGSSADTQRQLGAAKGESEMDFGTALAELLKGTGTELAGLKQNEIATLIQAYVASKARSAGQKAAFTGAVGNVAGLGGAALLGPH